MGNIYLHCGLIPHATRVPDGAKKSEGSQSFNRKIKQIIESETRWLSNPVGVCEGLRIYNIKEASLYMGRTVCALREMIWAGKLPVIRDGRKILLDIYDLDKWIEKSKITFTLKKELDKYYPMDYLFKHDW